METVNDENFKEKVLDSEIPVLVDFFADWCGPCRQLSPVLEEAEKELEGRLKIVKINIDNAPQTPTTYGVRGIPTMILFKNGESIETQVGAISKAKLLEWLIPNI